MSSFARRCGFSEGLIRAYLKGGKRPGMEHLAKIAQAASVSMDWLATGKEMRNRCAAAPSAQEERLLVAFRTMSSSMRAAALRAVCAMAAPPDSSQP